MCTQCGLDRHISRSKELVRPPVQMARRSTEAAAMCVPRRRRLCTGLAALALAAPVSALTPLYHALARAERASSRVMSVNGVYAFCRSHPAPPGEALGVVHVRGFAATPPSVGGITGLSVLFSHKVRASSVFRRVEVPLPGTNSTQLGVKILRQGLVVAWRGAGVHPPNSRIPDDPPLNVRIVVTGTLFCRDLRDNLSGYFVNGHGKPFMHGRGWTRSTIPPR
jgi:hypothetical protein